MARDYEYAETIDRKIAGHLKSLGYNISNPPKTMTVERKLSLLNYLRTITTVTALIEHEVHTTPTKG